MKEPFIPTGREFDEGELPEAPKQNRDPAAPPKEQTRATSIREFKMTVSPDVDKRRGGSSA